MKACCTVLTGFITQQLICPRKNHYSLIIIKWLITIARNSLKTAKTWPLRGSWHCHSVNESNVRWLSLKTSRYKMKVHFKFGIKKQSSTEPEPRLIEPVWIYQCVLPLSVWPLLFSLLYSTVLSVSLAPATTPGECPNTLWLWLDDRPSWSASRKIIWKVIKKIIHS